MKRLSINIIAFSLVLFLASSAFAQNTSIGIKGGPLFAKVAESNVDGSAVGLRLGGFITHSIVKDFGVGVEVNFARKGSPAPSSDDNIKLDYIEIPLLAQFFFGKSGFRPKVFAGAYYGYLLNAQMGQEDLSGYSDNDYGLLAGIGFHKSLGEGRWLYVDARYTHGLAEIIDGTDLANRDVSVNVGISFPLGTY